MIKHLVRAASPLVIDSAGMILFAALLALKVDVIPATIASMAIACGLVAWDLVSGRPVPPLQWLSAAIVLISAVATLFTGDPRFVMAKPSIVYAAIGVAMLRRGWMNRYVAPEDLDHVRDLMDVFGYIWAGLMFTTGVANLIVAIAFTAWWPAFIAMFPLVSKLVLFAIHFGVVFTSGRARGGYRKSRMPDPATAP